MTLCKKTKKKSILNHTIKIKFKVNYSSSTGKHGFTTRIAWKLFDVNTEMAALINKIHFRHVVIVQPSIEWIYVIDFVNMEAIRLLQLKTT